MKYEPETAHNWADAMLPDEPLGLLSTMNGTLFKKVSDLLYFNKLMLVFLESNKNV